MSIPVPLSEDAVVRPHRATSSSAAGRDAAGLHDLALAWRALRAPQWLHFLVVPALPLHALLAISPREALAHFLPAALVASLCLAFGYGINAIADRDGDRDGTKNPLAGRARVPTAVWIAVLASGIAALALAWRDAATLRATPVLISLAASALYSVGPRLKCVPVIGTLTNLFIFTPLAALTRLDGTDAPHLGLLLVTFVVLLTQNQLVHEAGDLVEDRGAGTASSTVIFGTRASTRAARALGIAAAFAFVAVWGPTGMVLFASAAPLGGGILIGSTSSEEAARVRHVHRRLSLIAGAILFLLAAASTTGHHP